MVAYLAHFPYIISPVYAKSLYRHSFIVVDAFPDIAKTTGGDGILGRLNEPFGNDVGCW